VEILVYGAGRMGQIRVEDLVTHPQVTRIVVANRNGERATQLASSLGVETAPFDSVDPRDFDSVMITTATANHAELLRKSMGKGRRIFCEKPIALELHDTSKIVEEAASIGCEVQIGFQRRFDKAMREAKRRIQSGEIGTLYVMHLVSHDHQPSPREFLEGSGSIYRDLHVHDFDISTWFADSEAESVFASHRVREHRQYAEFDDGDVSLIHLVTRNGVQVAISGTRHDPRGHDVRLEIFGSRDTVAAGLSSRTPLLSLDEERLIAGRPWGGFIERFRDAFRDETAAYVRWLADGGVNPCPPASAVHATEIAVACEISAREQRVVTIAEVRGLVR
jgi:myo-inositol 2-dehydrogenase/D-chiro-inositol 1-dehydrogenase